MLIGSVVNRFITPTQPIKIVAVTSPAVNSLDSDSPVVNEEIKDLKPEAQYNVMVNGHITILATEAEIGAGLQSQIGFIGVDLFNNIYQSYNILWVSAYTVTIPFTGFNTIPASPTGTITVRVGFSPDNEADDGKLTVSDDGLMCNIIIQPA